MQRAFGGAFYERICGYIASASAYQIYKVPPEPPPPPRLPYNERQEGWRRRKRGGDRARILYKILWEAFVTTRDSRVSRFPPRNDRALQQISRGKLLTKTFTLAWLRPRNKLRTLTCALLEKCVTVTHCLAHHSFTYF